MIRKPEMITDADRLAMASLAICLAMFARIGIGIGAGCAVVAAADLLLPPASVAGNVAVIAFVAAAWLNFCCARAARSATEAE